MALIPKGSYSVMAQRGESPDSLDDFPTPKWATRALMKYVMPKFGCFGQHTIFDRRELTVLEPACGRGYMIEVLKDYFDKSDCYDIYDYGCGYQVIDFLERDWRDFHWIITNPPFNKAEAFIEKSTRMAQRGVAMLLRSNFAETVGRYNRLFSKNPPSTIAQFSERVPMVKGRIDKKASTATAYAWFVWEPYRVENDTKFIWIPPCRKELEKAGDYE